MKKLTVVFLALFCLAMVSCSEEDRCFTCTLNATVVDVCTDNYREQAQRDNVDVDNLDEYVNLLVTTTGFDCVENP